MSLAARNVFSRKCVLSCTIAVCGYNGAALPAACEVKMIRAYPLIQDNLPAMGDDESVL